VSFARNLRALTGLHGLTGTQLADVLGLSRPAVSDLLAGKRNPSFETVLAIQGVFGISSELATESLLDLLPRFADRDRFVATVRELATRPGDEQRRRYFEVALMELERGR